MTKQKSLSMPMPPITSMFKGLTAKEAAIKAKKYYEELAGSKNRINLEEIELSDDKKYWFITLGIYTPTNSMFLLSQGINEAVNYKTFQVDARSGEVVSMKIKNYQAPK